ncbi:hypothetical protein KKG22_00740 [Patescibacteria group bacterium]|nr:hypothetical protein [Patescibacteria group bacterium]MBU1721911.1 hypothetical protein [Patescibacteria group bacterium]MBU1901204.1 hypothetical protein [Patescibacteria group bacterium]
MFPIINIFILIIFVSIILFSAIYIFKKNLFKIDQLVLNILGTMMIILPLFVYWGHIQWLGFPDGGLTELGEMKKKYFPLLHGLSTLLGILFLYFAWKFSSRRKKMIVIFLLVYLIMLLVSFLFFNNIGFNFENGMGG